MTDTKSKIDSFFDVLDGAMDKVESAVKPAEANQLEDSSVGDPHQWGRVDKATYHRFPDDGFETACSQTFAASRVDKLGPLSAGSVVPACTSCITGVGK